jgi:hypothetical protein
VVTIVLLPSGSHAGKLSYSDAMSGSNPFRRSTAAPIERDVIPRDQAITINHDPVYSINATESPKGSRSDGTAIPVDAVDG